MAKGLIDAVVNSNDYRRGKEDGYAAGLSGKDMSFFKMGTSLKAAIHGSKAMDTYAEGYKAGYALGSSQRLVQENLRREGGNNSVKAVPQGIQNNIQKPINRQSSMPVRGIDGQIDLLESMKAIFADFSETLTDIKNGLAGMHQNMDDDGLDSTILDKVEELDAALETNIDVALESIEDNLVPYIQSVIDYLDELL